MIFGFFKDGRKADTILIDVYSTLNFYFAYLISVLCSLFKKPFILFLHGGNLPLRYSRSPKLVNYMMRKAKRIVAPSAYLQSFFERKGFSVVLIPNLIDINKFPFQHRDFSYPALLYIRGFSKIYNPEMTVRAVARLVNDFPGIKLAMAGSDIDGSLHSVNDLIKTLQLEGHIKIYGRLSQQDWVKLSKEYNIMISNPVVDNTPVSVIEGMALGLVVISTNVGGISYLLRNNDDSILVESGDDNSMAEAISVLVKNPVFAAKLQAKARIKAASFSWDNIRPMWEHLLLH